MPGKYMSDTSVLKTILLKIILQNKTYNNDSGLYKDIYFSLYKKLSIKDCYQLLAIMGKSSGIDDVVSPAG